MSDSWPATRSGTTVSSLNGVPAPLRNAMTVDVEDYFHAEALSPCFPIDGWDLLESRVEANVDQLLALFAEAKVAATFFILGWVAERYPRMVVTIADAGHEIASHGYKHRRVDRQQRFEFEEDIRKATSILEDISGQAIIGYRAPTFSITRNNFWAFEVSENAGYRYSSSIFPIRHDNYGIHDAPRFAFHPPNSGILEIPLTTTVRFGTNFPSAGGGYFRLLPYWLSQRNMKRVNRIDKRPCVFYIHPWEIDPDQPRQKSVSRLSRWRHYTNLDVTKVRLERLLGEFHWGRMDRIFLGRADEPADDNVE
jgi:polysaccharide deacetylase family protein (PEP-CTERM system associated)